MQTTLTKDQKKILVRENVHVNGRLFKRVEAVIRFDDQCGNGHNSFSITGSFYRSQFQIDREDPEIAGCCHDELVRVFPELKHLVKWHLCNTDGPMHYISNTLYHSSGRDRFGLLAGEKAQQKTIAGVPLWSLVAVINGEIWYCKVEGVPDQLASVEQPADPAPSLTYKPQCRIGVGRAIDIDAARNTAVWPTATLEQLQSKEALQARLPQLLADMKADIEAFGFVW